MRADVSFLAAVFFILAWPATGSAAQLASAASTSTCVSCHETLADARLSRPPTLFSERDVHRERGFSCVDCHGGDPTAAERSAAHDPGRGFIGKPAGQGQIAACARCHGDAVFMRRYSPSQRVDQATE